MGITFFRFFYEQILKSLSVIQTAQLMHFKEAFGAISINKMSVPSNKISYVLSLSDIFCA